jgi:hypothetical protein
MGEYSHISVEFDNVSRFILVQILIQVCLLVFSFCVGI